MASRIRAEETGLGVAPDMACVSSHPICTPLTFGCPEVDGILPGGGLAAGLHEMQPQAHGDWTAALACVLALVGRRPAALSRNVRQAPVSPVSTAPILLCVQARSGWDMGRLYAPGLAAFGLRMERIVVVETARNADTLWAMEEGLGSGSLASVVGVTGPMAPTPARRLSLRAREHATPCLVLTPPQAPGALCALTRWRIGRIRSAPCPAGSGAPGTPRFRLVLDRCRQGGRPAAAAHMFTLEWCRETSRFRLAPRLADRAHASGHAGGRAS